MKQCVVFDGNTRTAKLMGVEYIISERLFKGLPDDEKRLWHSHVYEVKSGQLVAPGVPAVAEHQLMEKMISTYGKTWHTWHTDHAENTLPLGFPGVMMGFTGDGQAREAMVTERDQKLKVSSAGKRQQRADIVSPAIQPGADSWQGGTVWQVQLTKAAAR